MARCFPVLAALALLVPPAAPFRVRQRTRRHPRGTGAEKGTVEALYTWGAPGTASPGLRNPHSPEGCFPGNRAWAGKLFFNLTGTADIVPQLMGIFGYKHAMMDSDEYENQNNTIRAAKCPSQESQDAPGTSRLPDAGLHSSDGYAAVGRTVSEWFAAVSTIGNWWSYEKNETLAKEYVDALGWKYVAFAQDEGNPVTGGPQQVHLVQDPADLACLLTFQGSDSNQDWVSNFAFAKSHFCGLVERDEVCPGLTGSCTTRKEGGSFVHLGFRDHMRRIVQTDDFQSNVRPQLSGCSTLTVVGHSLGGAVGELFTACTARAPQPGEYGYEEDYKWIRFTKGSPRQLWTY